MTWGVGDNEFPFSSRKIAIGDIDGDALFAFGLEAVGQQGRIKLRVGRAMPDRVFFHRLKLILIDHLGVVQETANQGALAVIHTAAGQEAQQVLALMLGEVGFDIGRDQVRLVRHPAIRSSLPFSSLP